MVSAPSKDAPLYIRVIPQWLLSTRPRRSLLGLVFLFAAYQAIAHLHERMPSAYPASLSQLAEYAWFDPHVKDRPNAKEWAAIEALFKAGDNARCAFKPSQVGLFSSACPPRPLCTSRAELLSSYAYGKRAGYDQPFCFASCRPRWMNQSEICEVVSRYESILLMGDSLMRHLQQAMVMLVRGDVYNGSIKVWELDQDGEQEKLDCSCETALTSAECRPLVIRDLPPELPLETPLECQRSFELVFHLLLTVNDLEEAWRWKAREIELPTGHRKRAVFAGTGPWDSYNFTNISLTSRRLLKYMAEQAKDAPPTATEDVTPDLLSPMYEKYDVMWTLPPAAGNNKPSAWSATQGNPAILGLYDQMVPFLSTLGVPFLQRWNQTSQAVSFDGTHFGILPHLEQGMVLFNWLELGDTSAS